LQIIVMKNGNLGILILFLAHSTGPSTPKNKICTSRTRSAAPQMTPRLPKLFLATSLYRHNPRGCQLDVSGAAGPDGWLASEAKDIIMFYHAIRDELYQLWVDTTCSDTLSPADVDTIWLCRVAPLPKGDDIRGLGIFSVLVRGWHKSLNHLLPGAAPDQMAGKNCSVASPIADWFGRMYKSGAEIDFSAAYDTVIREVAYTANVSLGTPTHIAKTLIRAWSASRYVAAFGEISAPIKPERSVCPSRRPVCWSLLCCRHVSMGFQFATQCSTQRWSFLG